MTRPPDLASPPRATPAPARDPAAPRSSVVPLLTGALLLYAGLALAVARWWVSGLAAPLVAALLWRRHPRARFSAYVFLSVVAMRAVLSRSWPAGIFALLAIALLQTPAALRAWPRLRPGRRRRCYNGPP